MNNIDKVNYLRNIISMQKNRSHLCTKKVIQM